MPDHGHTTHTPLREGALIGLAGGLVSAVWFLVMGLLAGDPLRIPALLGQLFLGGERVVSADAASTGTILGYLALHFLFFLALGILLTVVTHAAARTAAVRMGILLGGVIGLGWLTYHLAMLPPLTEYAISFWMLYPGVLLGIATLALLLWRRHAALRRTFDEVGIGDAESRNPPAAPGGLNV